MFKKYLYLSIFSLSCFPLMAMEKEDVRDTVNKEIISLINPQSSDMSDFLPLTPQNHQHQALFDVAYGYLDFCYETEERSQSLSNYEQYIAVYMKDNIESAKNLVASIWQFDQGLTTLDKVLQGCLLGRLQLLEEELNPLEKHKSMLKNSKRCQKHTIFPRAQKRLKY